MNFLQRRQHLFFWVAIGAVSLFGGVAAIAASLNKPVQPNNNFAIIDQGVLIDSVHIEELHSDFLLRQSHNLYIEVQVHEELPITSLKAYHGEEVIGFIESKGTHIFNYSGHKIEGLTLKDPITGRVYLVN